MALTRRLMLSRLAGAVAAVWGGPKGWGTPAVREQPDGPGAGERCPWCHRPRYVCDGGCSECWQYLRDLEGPDEPDIAVITKPETVQIVEDQIGEGNGQQTVFYSTWLPVLPGTFRPRLDGISDGRVYGVMIDHTLGCISVTLPLPVGARVTASYQVPAKMYYRRPVEDALLLQRIMDPHIRIRYNRSASMIDA